jgi:hypothetical protein
MLRLISAISWAVVPCNLAEVYRRFGRIIKADEKAEHETLLVFNNNYTVS